MSLKESKTPPAAGFFCAKEERPFSPCRFCFFAFVNEW